jgi:TPR repeat protein
MMTPIENELLSTQLLYNKSYLHFTGEGVDKDTEVAARLLFAAASKHHPSAVLDAGRRAEFGPYRDLVAAKAYYQKAVELGHPDGFANLGRMHTDSGDYAEAIRCFVKAASLGVNSALVALGTFYEQGTGVDVDLSVAVSFYRIAALKLDTDGMMSLHRCYREGIGVDEDHVSASQLLKLAARLGNPRAEYELADAISLGAISLSDITESIETLMRRSARKGELRAKKWCLDRDIDWVVD